MMSYRVLVQYVNTLGEPKTYTFKCRSWMEQEYLLEHIVPDMGTILGTRTEIFCSGHGWTRNDYDYCSKCADEAALEQAEIDAERTRYYNLPHASNCTCLDCMPQSEPTWDTTNPNEY